jgi:hypothetical protein
MLATNDTPKSARQAFLCDRMQVKIYGVQKDMYSACKSSVGGRGWMGKAYIAERLLQAN